MSAESMPARSGRSQSWQRTRFTISSLSHESDRAPPFCRLDSLRRSLPRWPARRPARARTRSRRPTGRGASRRVARRWPGESRAARDSFSFKIILTPKGPFSCRYSHVSLGSPSSSDSASATPSRTAFSAPIELSESMRRGPTRVSVIVSCSGGRVRYWAHGADIASRVTPRSWATRRALTCRCSRVVQTAHPERECSHDTHSTFLSYCVMVEPSWFRFPWFPPLRGREPREPAGSGGSREPAGTVGIGDIVGES